MSRSQFIDWTAFQCRNIFTFPDSAGRMHSGRVDAKRILLRRNCVRDSESKASVQLPTEGVGFSVYDSVRHSTVDENSQGFGDAMDLNDRLIKEADTGVPQHFLNELWEIACVYVSHEMSTG